MALKTNKVLIFILKLAVSIASLYLIFSKTDEKQIILILKSIGVSYFLLVACVYLLTQLISTIRWKLLLPDKFEFKRLFSLYMIGAFFNSFMPSVIGGDVVKAYYLNKDAKKISLTLASIFMDRYVGFASLMIIGICAFPFSMSYFGTSPYKWLMPMIFVSFVIGSLLFFNLKLGRRFGFISEFYEYFVELKARGHVIIKTMLLSLVVQLMNFLMVVILASAMGEDIPLLSLFVFLPIIITITTLPISISGLGVREGSFVILLGLIGINPEAATSLSLAWFFSVFLGSLVGLVAYIRHTTNIKKAE